MRVLRLCLALGCLLVCDWPVSAADPQPASQVEHVPPEEALAILGSPVAAPDGKTIGRLVDVLVDASGAPEAAVIDVGGFMGVGARKIAVHWSVLHFAPANQKQPITLDLTLDQLKAAPEYRNPAKAAPVVLPAKAPGEANGGTTDGASTSNGTTNTPVAAPTTAATAPAGLPASGGTPNGTTTGSPASSVTGRPPGSAATPGGTAGSTTAGSGTVNHSAVHATAGESPNSGAPPGGTAGSTTAGSAATDSGVPVEGSSGAAPPGSQPVGPTAPPRPQ